MKARIRAGAWVGQDFTQKQWPIEEGTEHLIFEAEDIRGGRFRCTARGFGERPHYGNGALYVERRDLIPITRQTAGWFTDDEGKDHRVSDVMEELTTLEAGFRAALKHIDPTTAMYVADPVRRVRELSLSAGDRDDIEAIRKALGMMETKGGPKYWMRIKLEGNKPSPAGR